MAIDYKDYYSILGVDKDAPVDVIRKAYRKKAKKYHPDVNKDKDAEQIYKDVNEAWEVLKDADKRKRYDTLGPNWQQNYADPQQYGDYAPPEGDFDGFGGGGFSDFFRTIFGSFGGRASVDNAPFSFGGRRRNQEMELTLSLEDILAGGTKTLNYRQDSEMRTLNLNLPKGVTEGSRIRLPGKAPGGGDINIVIHIAPHPLYEIDGHNLTQTVSVAPWEAVLGAYLSVSTPSGNVRMKLPAGTQVGQKLRLKGKGLPMRGQNSSGDLFVKIEIAIPRKVSGKAKELWEELSKLAESDF